LNKFWWQILGLAVSYLFVFAIIACSALIRRWGASEGTARKLVHIGVGHWILFAPFFFPDWYFAVIGPASFIILNYLSYRYNLFKGSMELSENRTRGTVYYSVALTILVLFFWTVPAEELRPLAMLGMLTLAWGDGMASVVGERSHRGEFRIFGNRKTVAGSLAMWFFSCLVLTILPPLFLGTGFMSSAVYALIFGSVATAVELLTPKGLDNLTVPLVVSFGYYLCLSFFPAFNFAYA
jgi:phytol kinase